MTSPPKQFRATLTTLARRQARTSILNSEQLLEQFYYDCLLARVFLHDPDGWLVKGGQALLRRYPAARHTRDLDLLYKAASTNLDEAVVALRAAASLDLQDHLRFEFVDDSNITKVSHARRVASPRSTAPQDSM